MSIEKYIKTQCGLDRYYDLRKKSHIGILHKLRFYIYTIIASIRDLFS